MEISKKTFNRFEKWEKKYGIEYFMNDYAIISYPKAGRTWLRMIMAKLLDGEGYDTSRYEMMPAFHFSPDEMKEHHNCDGLKIIFLHRHLGDVMVSSYAERTSSFRSGMRFEKENIPIGLFLQEGNLGLIAAANWNIKWFANLGTCNIEDYRIITYEEMTEDTFKVIKKITNFMNLDIEDDKIINAIEYSKFENMKEIEHGKGKNFLKKYKGNFGSSPGRVRKGKVGGYVNHFDEQDLRFIHEVQSIHDNCPEVKHLKEREINVN